MITTTTRMNCSEKGQAMLVNTKFPPYEAPGGVPGFDGNPIEKMPARDLYSVDRKGNVVREVLESPENVNASRVRKMRDGKRLTPRQFRAAERFLHDWQRSETIVLAAVGELRSDDPYRRSNVPDAKLEAAKRFQKAGDALLQVQPDGRHHAIVALVVLDDVLLEVAASRLHIHHQRAAERLETALDALADHYGFGGRLLTAGKHHAPNPAES